MKKIITITLLLLTFISNAQKEQTTTLDAMDLTKQTSKREEVLSSKMIVCSNEDRDKWFAILPTFKRFDGVLVKSHLTTLKLNIGKCTNNDIIVFTFIGGRKMKVYAKNEKNCDDIIEVEFPLTSIDVAFLETKTLESIRYINGNDQTSFVYKSTNDDKEYFINILKK
jgi:hypothetical protein